MAPLSLAVSAVVATLCFAQVVEGQEDRFAAGGYWEKRIVTEECRQRRYNERWFGAQISRQIRWLGINCPSDEPSLLETLEGAFIIVDENNDDTISDQEILNDLATNYDTNKDDCISFTEMAGRYSDIGLPCAAAVNGSRQIDSQQQNVIKPVNFNCLINMTKLQPESSTRAEFMGQKFELVVKDCKRRGYLGCTCFQAFYICAWDPEYRDMQSCQDFLDYMTETTPQYQTPPYSPYSPYPSYPSPSPPPSFPPGYAPYIRPARQIKQQN